MMYFEDSGASKYKLGGKYNAEYGILDKNILGCAECAHVNHEMRDKFDLRAGCGMQDAGCGMKTSKSGLLSD